MVERRVVIPTEMVRWLERVEAKADEPGLAYLINELVRAAMEQSWEACTDAHQRMAGVRRIFIVRPTNPYREEE